MFAANTNNRRPLGQALSFAHGWLRNDADVRLPKVNTNKRYGIKSHLCVFLGFRNHPQYLQSGEMVSSGSHHGNLVAAQFLDWPTWTVLVAAACATTYESCWVWQGVFPVWRDLKEHKRKAIILEGSPPGLTLTHRDPSIEPQRSAVSANAQALASACRVGVYVSKTIQKDCWVPFGFPLNPWKCALTWAL